MSGFISGEHSPAPGDRPPSPPRRAYVPAVGPRLKVLLLVVFALAAVLGANSVYLASVTAIESATGKTYQNWFYQVMFLGHLGLGLLFVVPFLAFGLIHLFTARTRKNKRAVRVGYALFAASLVLLVSGFLLVRLQGLFDLKQPTARSVVYWAHVAAPLACLWLYWLHRLAGRKIKWRLGVGYAVAVAGLVAAMISLHSSDPRQWKVSGPKSGAKYFEPSLALTATGNFIPAETLMDDEYCKACHADVHAGWADSVHHISSFNNPAYLASVRETRQVSFERDGNVQASRWCAGCHDPVPFFSGAFDDPKFDDQNHPTAKAGITCSVCHAITNVNSTRGNADYTIEEPEHYPFAFSDNAALLWLNHQLIKAKPTMHKKTFLKDFHKSAEFCSTCHKVHQPFALTHYKEFLRGQNHYDPFLLSGVSGHGARSFYYPEKAQSNCNECHMPRTASNDFGAKPYGDSQGTLQVHNHLFPAANTGVAWLKGREKVAKAHQDFLAGTMRVDLFGVREDGTIDGKLVAPLRPEVPTLEPGKSYLFETVIRTLKLGHTFTQGTADSNEIWLDVTARSGDRVVGRSGAMDGTKEVDRWSHFVNNFVIDRNGNRINRRNPQDIFTTLYNHQIPPGAGQTVHYGFKVPDDLTAPLTVEVKLQYRKFDAEYMRFVAATAKPGDDPIPGNEPGKPYLDRLPVTTLAADSVTFPVAGVAGEVKNPARDIPEWQRWNDYGIGLLLKGKAELRQAAEAFEKVEALGRFDGPLNLARVLEREGRINEATDALGRAAKQTDPAPPPWTMAWLSGVLNREQGRLPEAEKDFRSVLETHTPEMVARGFDFSLDYEVINLLGQTLFDQARQVRTEDRKAERDELLRKAAGQFEKTLTLDSEDVPAHYNLSLIYRELGETEKAEGHRKLHARYKPDDNATDRAVRLAREKYPAANHAAEAVVIYDLRRPGAPGLTETQTAERPDEEVSR
jgi:tetratricopeptide (TPR) repeat protein